MTPAWSAFAARSALPMSRLQIEPDRPYGVALARRSASSSVSNGMIDTTGPKISSRGDAHVVVDAVEDRRHEVRAVGQGRIVGRRAADDDRRALALADLDVVRDPVALLEADERPDLGRLVGRVADLDVPGRRGEQLDDLVVDGALDEDPAPGAAVLAARCRRPSTATRAANFSRSASAKTMFGLLPPSSSEIFFTLPDGQPHDLLAGRRLAGERDLADARDGRRSTRRPCRPGRSRR